MALTDDPARATTRPPAVVDVDTLRHMAVRIIEATGSSSEDARVVGRSLVDSNLVGHDSHGVMRLQRYVSAVSAGDVIPSAAPTWELRSPGSGHVDGQWGWGQVAAELATARAIELARAGGVGAVTISRCNHIGRLGTYAAQIAAAGMIGIVLCNAEPVVAPFRGHGRLLGTNPVALACPRRGDSAPIVLDIATSSVAEGKLSVAQAQGRHVPDGLLVDAMGRGSRNPRDFYDGGALLPFGAHKGYGISVFVEILGGILSGAGAASSAKYQRGNGTLVLALDVSNFVPLEEFEAEVEDLADRLLSAGEAADAVMVPGQLEAVTRSQRIDIGIALPDETWHELLALAEELGIDTADSSGAGRASDLSLLQKEANT